MKTTTLSICFALGLSTVSICQVGFAQTDCEYRTRIEYDFPLDLPPGFTGSKDFNTHGGRTINVATKSCEGPFTVVLTLADGSSLPSRTFVRGNAVSDTMYIEMPDPPYDLQMHVETVYKATEVK